MKHKISKYCLDRRPLENLLFVTVCRPIKMIQLHTIIKKKSIEIFRPGNSVSVRKSCVSWKLHYFVL